MGGSGLRNRGRPQALAAAVLTNVVGSSFIGPDGLLKVWGNRKIAFVSAVANNRDLAKNL